jgi:hypothetical protein
MLYNSYDLYQPWILFVLITKFDVAKYQTFVKNIPKVWNLDFIIDFNLKSSGEMSYKEHEFHYNGSNTTFFLIF